jgi:hypothetical protein
MESPGLAPGLFCWGIRLGRYARGLEGFFAGELSRLDPLAAEIDGFSVSDVDIISLSVGVDHGRGRNHPGWRPYFLGARARQTA